MVTLELTLRVRGTYGEGADGLTSRVRGTYVEGAVVLTLRVRPHLLCGCGRTYSAAAGALTLGVRATDAELPGALQA